MKTPTKIWFHRTRAITWVIIGALSFPLHYANNVMVVWLASVYANTISDWGAGEAADDRHLEAQLTQIHQLITRHQHRRRKPPPKPRRLKRRRTP